MKSGKPEHRQVQLIIGKKIIEVDSGVKRLIQVMNSISGIVTFYSCQGGRTKNCPDPLGYVQFGGTARIAFVACIAEEIVREIEVWNEKHGRHICRGCQGMSITLEITFPEFSLHWMSWDYRRLIKMVERVKSTLSNNSSPTGRRIHRRSTGRLLVDCQ